jgi:hypothetical protein
MAGFASIFGLLLQVLLIIVVARLIFAWWQRRSLAAAPSYAASNPATGYSFGSFSGILNSIAIAKSGEQTRQREANWPKPPLLCLVVGP